MLWSPPEEEDLKLALAASMSDAKIPRGAGGGDKPADAMSASAAWHAAQREKNGRRKAAVDLNEGLVGKSKKKASPIDLTDDD